LDPWRGVIYLAGEATYAVLFWATFSGSFWNIMKNVRDIFDNMTVLFLGGSFERSLYFWS
jgi:hypothetical protein